jgi:hypothetical protein
MPLIYRDRGPSGIQIDVMSGVVRIATLWKHAARGSNAEGEDWRWSFTMSVGPPGFEAHGREVSRVKAQYELERIWLRWVHDAGLAEQG